MKSVAQKRHINRKMSRMCNIVVFSQIMERKSLMSLPTTGICPTQRNCPFWCWDFCIDHFFQIPNITIDVIYHLHLVGVRLYWAVFTTPRPVLRNCTPSNLPLVTYIREECKLDVNDKDCLCVESTQMWFCLCFRIILYICIIINRHILNIRYLRLIYCVCEKNRLSICL